MKKLLALLLAAVMVLSLAACGGTNTDPTQAPTDGATEPTEGSYGDSYRCPHHACGSGEQADLWYEYRCNR